MSEKTECYGASDDIVVVSGGKFSDEFYPGTDDDEKYYLAFSDGSVFRVKYDGCWRFTQVARGAAAVAKVEADETDPIGSRPDGKPWYSDIVTLDGEIKWVVGGKDFAK